MFGIRGVARAKARREPARFGDAGAPHDDADLHPAAGHDAGRVTVKTGRPILLVFQRIDSDPRSECVAIPALGRLSTLSRHSRVELPPCAAGEYALCAKDGSTRGTLVVEP